MIEHLTKETFKEKIFDYSKEKEFKYVGKLPVVVDFYADWCGPCKMVSPILEDLAVEYRDIIDIYKINTEHEETLSKMFGIRSIPSILFIPLDGEPKMAQGAMSKVQFEKLFKDIFEIEKPALPKGEDEVEQKLKEEETPADDVKKE
ncbi:MAG: thioredoxin [Bacteroidales bacterium]|nr:thioredoxin [Bacteroidales bacterium]